jgi:aspartyl-tRNA(Asn)/glutamyl-tRNA(Gln) amidotransferase subunit A
MTDVERHIADHLERSCRHREIGALYCVDKTRALEKARALDARTARGERLGALGGQSVCIKDNIVTRAFATTAGSRLLEGYRPPYDATVVSRLEAADAIVLGKTNLDEFAMGSSCEQNAHFVCRNPWDLERVAGGSSGGSAAAVAACLCDVALGSDTGGSIRQPAAFCGVTGLKPTYGRVSRYGLIALASSLDQIGPIARTARACRQVLAVIEGPDGRDATCVGRGPIPKLGQHDEPWRIGIPRAALRESTLQPEIRRCLHKTEAALERLGTARVDVSLPHLDYALAAYYVLASAEAASNLARYDGCRYGRRSEQPADDPNALITQSRSEGFGREVKRRILLGTFVLKDGYESGHYARAQNARRLIRDDFERVFKRCDAVLLPTTPETAFRLGAKLDQPRKMYASDVFTVAANLAGLPALSFPAGFDDAGLPIGLQLIGRAFQDELLLSIVERFQAHSDHHRKRPPLSLLDGIA